MGSQAFESTPDGKNYVEKETTFYSEQLLALAFIVGLDTDKKDELVKNFQETYNLNGLYDLTSQVPFLSRLAEHYESMGISSGNNWVHLIKVNKINAY